MAQLRYYTRRVNYSAVRFRVNSRTSHIARFYRFFRTAGWRYFGDKCCVIVFIRCTGVSRAKTLKYIYITLYYFEKCPVGLSSREPYMRSTKIYGPVNCRRNSLCIIKIYTYPPSCARSAFACKIKNISPDKNTTTTYLHPKKV